LNITEQERRADELDRVAPPDKEAAQRRGSTQSNASDDPADNLERALESGQENPV
jgi:hypothetical protein